MEKPRFKSHFPKFLTNNKFMDFDIKCGSNTWQVHRLVLASHSKYFETLFEKGYKESEERSIELKEDDVNAIKLMIDYFYLFDYKDEHDKLKGFSNPLELNAAVYIVADKYDVPDLKKLALAKFVRAAPSSALRHENPVEAIRLAFTGTPSTDRALRDVVLDYWTIFAGTLVNGKIPNLTSSVVKEVPQFACEILQKNAKTAALSFEASYLTGTGKGHEDKMLVDTVAEVFTRRCKICKKLMSDHTELMAYNRPDMFKPFWVDWSDL